MSGMASERRKGLESSFLFLNENLDEIQYRQSQIALTEDGLNESINKTSIDDENIDIQINRSGRKDTNGLTNKPPMPKKNQKNNKANLNKNAQHRSSKGRLFAINEEAGGAL